MEEEFGNGEIIMVIVSEVFLLDRVVLWVFTVKYMREKSEMLISKHARGRMVQLKFRNSRHQRSFLALSRRSRKPFGINNQRVSSKLVICVMNVQECGTL